LNSDAPISMSAIVSSRCTNGNALYRCSVARMNVAARVWR
jgi:hypothetical protein